jgi:hypothetical protein
VLNWVGNKLVQKNIEFEETEKSFQVL